METLSAQAVSAAQNVKTKETDKASNASLAGSPLFEDQLMNLLSISSDLNVLENELVYLADRLGVVREVPVEPEQSNGPALSTTRGYLQRIIDEERSTLRRINQIVEAIAHQ